LRNVPIEDPVDRRNAPFMQGLLIVMGSAIPVNKVIHFLSATFRGTMTSAGLSMDALTDLMMVGVAWTSLYLLRKGQFRKAVGLYLAVMLVAGAMAYAVIGIQRLSNDPFPLLLLGLAGLMLGRGWLWAVFGSLMLIFVIGTVSDEIRMQAQGSIDWQWGIKASMVVSYLVVAVMLDRTIAALRHSLSESNARGQQLERANRWLEHEMAERERTMEQLVHAQKMEAVGCIASGVAHDFDNILGVILGYTSRREHLADRGASSLMGALDGIHTAAERATLISRQLLGFSRHDVTRLIALDLREVMQAVIPMMRQLFGAQVKLIEQLPEQPLWIEMDRSQLELSLLSIASNANDAMPDGGRFRVSVQRVDALAVIELADSGQGINEHVAAHIFEPFYTTKPAGSGTGLGLSVVHDVISHAGGSVTVRSHPGEGATFVIQIPLIQPLVEAESVG